MKKILQEFHKQRKDWNEDKMVGDCWRACVASLLELPLNEVPHFAEIWDKQGLRTSMHSYSSFLADNGYIYYPAIPVTTKSVDAAIKKHYQNKHKLESDYYFAIGNTDRGDDLHVVLCYKGKIVHDPHPSNSGLTNVKHIEILIPLI